MTNDGLNVQLTKVLSNRALNEVTVGYSSYLFGNENLTHVVEPLDGTRRSVRPHHHRIAAHHVHRLHHTGNNAAPRYRVQNLYSVKDNFTFSYDAIGRHDLKTGGEFLLEQIYTSNCTQCMGLIDARNGPAPANLESILPDPLNVDTWNLAALLVAHSPLHARRAFEPARAGARSGRTAHSCRTTGT